MLPGFFVTSDGANSGADNRVRRNRRKAHIRSCNRPARSNGGRHRNNHSPARNTRTRPRRRLFASFVSRWPLQRAVRCPLLSEIFADDFAIELFPMWPFEQQPELGFKPFTNRWQFGQHNGLPSCECRVDGPQNRPVQRHHQDFVRAARPTRRDRMFEVSETIDQMSGHERSHRQPDFGRPRAESFGIEVVKIYHHR